MSNSQNKKNEQQNNLCTTLTEQWKKGELEDGTYWVKSRTPVQEIVMYEYISKHSGFGYYEKDVIQEVLAPVPSYEEWQLTKYSLDDYKRLCDMRGKIIDKMDESNEDTVKHLRQKNAQLKELLEEIVADADLSYCDSDIELRIDEVLK